MSCDCGEHDTCQCWVGTVPTLKEADMPIKALASFEKNGHYSPHASAVSDGTIGQLQVAERESIRVLRECIELQNRKGADYQSAKSSVVQAMHYRRGVDTIHDMIEQKILRARSLIEAGTVPSNESLEDTYKDMANYASFAVAYLRGRMDGQHADHDAFNRPRPAKVGKPSESQLAMSRPGPDIKQILDTTTDLSLDIETVRVNAPIRTLELAATAAPLGGYAPKPTIYDAARWSHTHTDESGMLYHVQTDVKVYLADGRVVFARNSDKLFVDGMWVAAENVRNGGLYREWFGNGSSIQIVSIGYRQPMSYTGCAN